MLIGMRLTFHRGGSGTMDEWGFDHFHINPDYVTEPKFDWKTTGDRIIEITHRGESALFGYDFRISTSEYGIRQLRIFQVGRKPNEHGDIGFWVSPFSLVYEAADVP